MFELVVGLFLGLLAFVLWYSLQAGAPWVPTGRATRNIMLALLELAPGEMFIDLGCGDGSILIEAVRTKQVHAIGFEINPILVAVARARVRNAGLEKDIEIRCVDFFKAPLPHADAVALFLLPEANTRVARDILPQCAPGTRIVSHTFSFRDREPVKKEMAPTGRPIFLYRI